MCQLHLNLHSPTSAGGGLRLEAACSVGLYHTLVVSCQIGHMYIMMAPRMSK
jgi:hypothetical protein